MSQFRYILEPYKGPSTRHACPNCKKAHQFTYYIDALTENIIASHVGKCNRINNCGYHFTPKQFFSNEPGIHDHAIVDSTEHIKAIPASTNYIDQVTFKESMLNSKHNCFINYLYTLFDIEIVESLIFKYNIGTSNHWGGETTIFWQMDINGKLRTGKLIKYGSDGKRMKGHINWVHSILGSKDYNLKQCFFGEHLLSMNTDTQVGIVESEKTAIIASVFLPELTWISSGGIEGFSEEKLKPLENRQVIMFPDLSIDNSTFIKWFKIAYNYNFSVSNYLELNATNEDKKGGLDLADFLLRNKPRGQYPLSSSNPVGLKVEDHSNNISNVTKRERVTEPDFIIKESHNTSFQVNNTWDIESLIDFYETAIFPDCSVILKSKVEHKRIVAYETITNPQKFFKTHLEIVIANKDKKTYKPYFDRLIRLIDIIEKDV